MERKIDLIERYLMNNLSVSEQLALEELLREDQDLMKELLFRKKVNSAIAENDVINLRDTIDEIINIPVSSEYHIKNKFVLSSLAALIILFIVISGIYLFPANEIEPNELFQAYYSPYPVIENVRSAAEQTSTEKLLSEAFNLYQSGKYDISYTYFQETLNKDNKNKMALFYMGNCEIANDNLKESIQWFNKLVQENDHIFWEQSHWYLALIYLKKDDLSNAKYFLNTIIKEDMSQRAEAEEILTALK